jgi:serine/threonine protein phosphatase PrpC
VSLAFEVAAQTDVGCVRTRNEDSFGYDLDRGIFVVCDGVGGHAAGEVASRIAVESLLRYFRESSPGKPGSYQLPAARFSHRAVALGEAIQLANTAICEAASRDESCAGMGSTVVSIVASEDIVSVGHVGDSRAYLIRAGAIQQLTQDHSLVTEDVQLGLITADQAKESQLQNVITRALGAENTVEPDLDDIIAVAGDKLMLASDGLTRTLGDGEILAAVDGAPDLDQACEDLIQAAKAAGGEDNITCMLIHFVELPWYKIYRRKLRMGGRNGKIIS